MGVEVCIVRDLVERWCRGRAHWKLGRRLSTIYTYGCASDRATVSLDKNYTTILSRATPHPTTPLARHLSPEYSQSRPPTHDVQRTSSLDEEAKDIATMTRLQEKWKKGVK